MTDWRFDFTVNEMGEWPMLDLRVDVRVMERFGRIRDEASETSSATPSEPGTSKPREEN